MRVLTVLLVLLTGGADSPSQAPAPGLEVVAFMEGCWRGPLGRNEGDFVEERYGPPSGDLMLGTVKYVLAGRPTQHEFIEIRATADGAVSFLPYPGGRRSEHTFLLTSADGGAVVFEAPEHDFPKRIIYRALGADGLQGSADGGADDPQPRTWPMSRISCDGE